MLAIDLYQGVKFGLMATWGVGDVGWHALTGLGLYLALVRLAEAPLACRPAWMLVAIAALIDIAAGMIFRGLPVWPDAALELAASLALPSVIVAGARRPLSRRTRLSH